MEGVYSTTPFHTRIAAFIVASKCHTLHHCLCINNTTDANENNEKTAQHGKLVLIDVTRFFLPGISLANLLINLKDKIFDTAVGTSPNLARMCG